MSASSSFFRFILSLSASASRRAIWIFCWMDSALISAICRQQLKDGKGRRGFRAVGEAAAAARQARSRGPRRGAQQPGHRRSAGTRTGRSSDGDRRALKSSNCSRREAGWIADGGWFEEVSAVEVVLETRYGAADEEGARTAPPSRLSPWRKLNSRDLQTPRHIHYHLELSHPEAASTTI